MIEHSAPLLAGLALFAFSTLIGVMPMRKLIEVREAQHELRAGSASRLRQITGWTIIAFWLMTVWFLSTILGDWTVGGDLDGAIARSWLRLRILLEIAAALGEQ
jgi:hypothetical protein